MFDTCIILAGGRGERLRPHTNTTPKPLIDVHGGALVARQIDFLFSNGIQNFLLLTGYLGEQFDALVSSYRDKPHVRVEAVRSEDSLLTLQRVALVADQISGDALIVYGDNYVELDVPSLYRQFKYSRASQPLSVLAPKRFKSKSKPRLYKENIKTYNPYSELLEAPTDVGFFCINTESLRYLIEIEPNLEQRFEDWYFNHSMIDREYFVTYWGYLSLTDEDSLIEARNAIQSKLVLFLDRDGVITSSRSDSKYTTCIDDLVFNAELFEQIKAYSDHIEEIVIVTNQPWASGRLCEYYAIESYVKKWVAEKSSVSRVSSFTCTHQITERCFCRKPKPGLLLKYLATRRFPLLRSKAVFIGDSVADYGMATHLVLKYYDVKDSQEAFRLNEATSC